MPLADKFVKGIAAKVEDKIETQLGEKDGGSPQENTQTSNQQANKSEDEDKETGWANLAGAAAGQAGATVNQAMAQGQQTIAAAAKTSKAAVVGGAIAAGAITQLGGVQLMILFGMISHIFDIIVASNRTFYVNSLTIGADIVIFMFAFILNFLHKDEDWKDWILRLVVVCFVAFMELQGFGLFVERFFGQGYIGAGMLNPLNKMWFPLWFLGGIFILIWRGQLFSGQHRFAQGLFFAWVFVWVILLMGHVSGFAEDQGWTDTVYNPYADAQDAAAGEKFGALQRMGFWLSCVTSSPSSVQACMDEKTQTPEQKEDELKYWIDNNLNKKFDADLESDPFVNIGVNEITIEADLMGVDNNLDRETPVTAEVTCGTVEENDKGTPNPATLSLKEGFGAVEKITCKLEGLQKRDTTGQIVVEFKDLEVEAVLPALFWNEENKRDAFDNYRENTDSLNYANIVRKYENEKRDRSVKILNDVFEEVDQTRSYIPENFEGNYKNSLVLSSTTQEFILPVISLGGEAVQGFEENRQEGLEGKYLRSKLSMGIVNNIGGSYASRLQRGKIKQINTEKSFVYLPKYLAPEFSDDNCVLLSETGEKDTESVPGHTGYRLRQREGDDGNKNLMGITSLEPNKQKSIGTCMLKVTDPNVGANVIYDTISAKLSYDYEKASYAALMLVESDKYQGDASADHKSRCIDQGIYEKPIVKWLENATTAQIEEKIRGMAYSPDTYYGSDISNIPKPDIKYEITNSEGSPSELTFLELAMKVAKHESTSSLRVAGDGGYSIPPFNMYVCVHSDCMRDYPPNRDQNKAGACYGNKCNGFTVADNLDCAVEAGLRHLWNLLRNEVAKDNPDSNSDDLFICGVTYDTPAERALRRFNGMQPDCNEPPQKCYVSMVMGEGSAC